MSHKIEWFCLSVFMLVLFGLLYNFFNLSFYCSAADSAGFVDIITNIHAGKGMVSSAFSSLYSVLPYLTYHLDQYMKADYKSLYHSQDFMKWHPYLIAYLMSFFKYAKFSSLQIASGSMALSLTGSLYGVYFFLRENKVPLVYALSFTLILLCYVPFIGNIFGQFYFDRFFIFFELLLLILLYQKLNNGVDVDKWIIPIFCMTVMISERPAMLASLTIIYYLLIYSKNISLQKDWYLFALPLCGFLYLYIYMHFFQDSLYYSKINFDSILKNLKASLDFTQLMGQKTQILILFILPLLILSLVNSNFFILSILAIIPNFIISIGGAEKIGFTTHYHAIYLPFLIFSAAIGVIHLSRVNKQLLRHASLVGLMALIFGTNFIDRIDLAAKSFVTKLDIRNILPNSSVIMTFDATKQFYRKLFSSLPHNIAISSLEWSMPALVDHSVAKIDYFPIGLGHNDYLLVEYVKNSQPTMPNMMWYLHDLNEKVKIAQYVQGLIDDKYFIFQALEFNNKSYVIYKSRDIDI